MKTHNIKSTILTNEVYIQYFNICVHWCRFLQLFHLAGTLNSNSPLPLPLTHGDHLSTLCFCEFGYFRSLMSVKSCSICPSVTGRKCLGTTSGCSYRKNISRMHIQRVILVFLIFTSGHWLQSMRLLRVGHDWATSPSLFTFMHWRRKWQPTPVFLPGESQGGGAWWAAVYGVAQSRARLKRLSSSSNASF